MPYFRLRNSEWIVLAFFAYIVLLIPFFQDRPNLDAQPLAYLLLVGALFCGLALAECTRFGELASMVRDWMPLALTLVAFHEMELFVPTHYNAAYEAVWIRWDSIVLTRWGFTRILESLGPVIPFYLELCYLLVYGVGAFCILVLWFATQRRGVDRFNVVLMTGTFCAYALFPYFPSHPPRLAFPLVAEPHIHNAIRDVNLLLLEKATIHSGVFPSAHVSSAFSAAWGMFLVLPRRKRVAWGLLIYAISVAVATVYGRYHYTADAVAGFAISLLAAAVFIFFRVLTSSDAIHVQNS